jgi:hypothetical protein
MSEKHYWKYEIYAPTSGGGHKLVAQYVAATERASIHTDVHSGNSYLEDFLRRFYQIDPQVYAEHYPLRAESLLGALLAKMHCAWKFGILGDLTPPAARAVHHVEPNLGQADHVENGVTLWLIEEGDTVREVDR